MALLDKEEADIPLLITELITVLVAVVAGTEEVELLILVLVVVDQVI